jgi:hypothetical protein
MSDSLISILTNPTFPEAIQIKASTEGGIRGEGAKASGFFGRIAQGIQRLFNREIQQRNREGIEGYLSQLREQYPDLEQAARSELRGRISSGSPLTLRKIREIGSGVLARSALEKAERLLRGLYAKTTPELTENDYELLLSAKSSLELIKAHGPQSSEFAEVARLVGQRISGYELRIGEPRGAGGFLS